jgi:hypothetical protein
VVARHALACSYLRLVLFFTFLQIEENFLHMNERRHEMTTTVYLCHTLRTRLSASNSSPLSAFLVAFDLAEVFMRETGVQGNRLSGWRYANENMFLGVSYFSVLSRGGLIMWAVDKKRGRVKFGLGWGINMYDLFGQTSWIIRL